MHSDDQQALPVGAGQIAFEEGELVLAQSADVGRLPSGLVDDIVEQDEIGFLLLPCQRVRTVVMAEGQQRVLVARRIEIQVVVARYVQPRNAKPCGGAVDVGIQRQIVVDDVAQGEAHIGCANGAVLRGLRGDVMIAGDRFDDVAGVVIHVDARLGLRIGKNQDLQPLAPRARQLLAPQTDVGTGTRRPHATISENGRRSRDQVAPEIG